MRTVDLSRYDNSWYDPGRPALTRLLWLVFGLPVLRSSLPIPSRIRAAALRSFGARVGRGVVIKPGVAVKYPWHLTIGDHCWIGEQAWIDNLTTIRLDDHVCISQGAYLCTGNHDWTDPAFGLRVASIHLSRGSWVGARATLLPGSDLGEGAIAGAGSVVSGPIPAGEVHAGNPAQFVRRRELREEVRRTATSEPRRAAPEPVSIASFRSDSAPAAAEVSR